MALKKYMIRCDIEGVSGVVSYEQAEPGKSEYELGLRMFKSDLCACVNGLLEGGADEDAKTPHDGNIITFHRVKDFRGLVY